MYKRIHPRIKMSDITYQIRGYPHVVQKKPHLSLIQPITGLFETPTSLRSFQIKKEDADNVYFSSYHDQHQDIKNKIISFLKKVSGRVNHVEICKQIKSLTQSYRYFIKTDLVGAYYNVTFDLIKQTILRNVTNVEMRNYLIGFFEFIHLHYEKEEYLYITDYSEYILCLILKDYISISNLVFRMDDIMLYGNNLTNLFLQVKQVSDDLKQIGLYLNANKTFYMDVIYDSVYFLRTIITTPICGWLDNNVKYIINESIKTCEPIRVYELNDVLYEYFAFIQLEIENNNIWPKPKIEITTIKKVSHIKKLFHHIILLLTRAPPENNEKKYNPLIIETKTFHNRKFGMKYF